MSILNIDIASLLRWTDPKRVETKQGPRILQKGTPTPLFWEHYRSYKDALKEAGISVSKNNAGQWEVCWWQPLPKQEQERIATALAASRATDADIEIPAPVGLEYLPYQKAGIAYALTHNNVLFGDEMGLGKAQPVWERVLTPTGWRQMGEIKAGDFVIGSNGKPTKVLGVFPQGEKEVFEVTFSDGSKTTCCDEHLWTVNSPLRRWRKAESRTLSLREIKHSLADSAGTRQHFIPMVAPVEFQESTSLPIMPYTMGILLGDGTFKYGYTRISTEDRSIVERVSSELPGSLTLRHIKGPDWGIVSNHSGAPNQIRRALVAMGLQGLGSDSKFIPESYLRASLANRKALLQGLMDSDGYAAKDGTLQFSSNSVMLTSGMRDLVHSLGGVARSTIKKSASGKDHHTLTINLPEGVEPFFLTRKAIRCKTTKKYKPSRAFSSVQSVGKTSCVCIKVAAEDQLYVTRDYIVTHNTIQAIGTFNADPTIKTVLIVCPATLKLNWRNEFNKWATRPVSIAVVSGTKGSLPDASVVIVNFDILKHYREAIDARQWDLAIFDEVHYAKNPEAQRTVAVFGHKGKGKAPIVARRKLFLTGTPLVNRPKELWTLVHSLDPEGLGRNFFTFAKRYCNAYHNGYGWDFNGASKLDELQRLLRERFMVRRLKADVLSELPPKRRQILLLDTEGNASVRRLIERENREYSEHLDRGESLPFTEMSTARHELAVLKIPYVIEHLKEALEAGPVICFAHHRDVVEAIHAAFPGSVTLMGGATDEQKQAAVESFQTGRTNLFIGNMKAAGVGITLTRSSHVVFAEQSWVPGDLSQCEDRAHRIGQHDSVFVQHLVFAGSLDERMMADVIEKQKVLDNALDTRKDVDFGGEAKTQVTVTEKPAPEVHEVIETVKGKGVKVERVVVAKKTLTAEQVEAVHQGLRVIAGYCDGAVTLDGQGFSKIDRDFGHSLARAHSLSQGQAQYGKRLVTKYKRQVPSEVLAILGVTK